MELEEVRKEKGSRIKDIGKKKMAMGAVAALLVLAAAGVIWQFMLPPSADKTDVASLEKMAYPLPEKPPIAVLPFCQLERGQQTGAL